MIYSLLSLPDEIPDFNRWKNRVLDVTGIEFDQSMKTLFNNLIGWHLEMMEKNEHFFIDYSFPELLSQPELDHVA